VTTGPDGLTVIAGDEALAAFRASLTGAHALGLLQQAQGRLLVQSAVGVGKTELMVRTIEHALTVAKAHDLVVVLVPRRDLLHELLGRLPAGTPRVVLTPRPRPRCGALDAEWLQYEQSGCSLLGREQLCGACPRRKGCRWPGQLGRRLRGARLVLATQAHLALNPQFVSHLRHHTGATNPLVLLDESDFLVRSKERAIRPGDLERFLAAQDALLAETEKPTARMERWRELTHLLTQAPTPDLRAGGWSFPRVRGAWAAKVQRRGRELFGQAFRFLGFELHGFARSDRASRERLPTGEVRFAALPDLGEQFIVFSGSVARELARYRLDPDFARPTLVSPFQGYRFEHPGTRWFNLNTLIGTARYFPRNAAQVLDFFAHLIARNIQQGKRTLLVSRKMFVRRCRDFLRRRLSELGAGPVQVVTGNWGGHDLQDPRTVPLISYGVVGLNAFQHIEAAYALNSYYVSAATVADAVHDLDASEERYPITVRFAGEPRRREARVSLPDARETILPRIAQGVLEQKEADVVVQALGRVRPFTKAREVISFQAGELPGVSYTLEFTSLAQARSYFGVPTAQEAGLASRAEKARRLRALGKTQKQIAQELGVSVSTVKRCLHG
jgi:hypothetical protein